MSKLVTRAASRALGTARRAGVTSRPSPRPTTAFAPSRADPRVDGGTRPTWHQHHHHPWHPRRAFRRVADPRGTAVPAPTTRSLLFPARTRPRALPSDETAREPADPSALTVPELKALLRARGQRVGGRKAELVDRVLATGGGISDRPRAYSTSTDAAPDVAAVASNSSSSLSSSPSSPSSRSSRSRSPKRPPRMRWEVSDPPPPPRRPHLDADAPALRVLSWNVNGVRALLEKDPDILDRIAEEESADVVVLQETKLQAKMVPEMDARVLEKYPHRVWNCATSRLGYSGVAMFCRSTPTSTWSDPFVVDGFEGEGRVVAFELDRAFVVGAYVPNSGDGLKRLDARVNAWDPAMSAYLRELESRGKPVVFCGDLNVARAEMDLWGRHRENARAPGFTPEERESFASLLVGDRTGGGLGMVDTFRHTHPSAAAYSWWSYRGGARDKNRGWRIDYVLVSAELGERGAVHEGYIRGDVGGSDHCPVGVVLSDP